MVFKINFSQYFGNHTFNGTAKKVFDSDWLNYPNNKPETINRHGLMHGMYDIEDVEKADCVKLLLMLVQMTMLYSTLR